MSQLQEAPHIAYICADRGIPIKSGRGSSVHINEIVSALARVGAKVTLLANRVSAKDEIADVPIVPIVKDQFTRKIIHSIEIKKNIELSREFLDLCQNIELRKLLDRLHRQNPLDFVIERMSLFSFAGIQFARSRKIPFLLEVNSPLIQEQMEYRQLKLKDFASPIETMLMREANKIIAVSDGVGNYAISRGVKPKNIFVLPNAANKKFMDIPSCSSKQSSPFTIGFVGSLKPWHGVNDLLIAFKIVTKKIADSKLLIVGDGPEKTGLESRSRRLGLEKKVEWTGEVMHEKIPRLLSKMDVVTAPYPKMKRFYFSPIKIFEYMAAGRAIVASRMGQLTEILEHGKTALLYKSGYVEALANHIISLYADPSLRKMLGKRANAAAKSRTWDHNARKILELLKKMQ